MKPRNTVTVLDSKATDAEIKKALAAGYYIAAVALVSSREPTTFE
jgi:hypothetical protein